MDSAVAYRGHHPLRTGPHAEPPPAPVAATPAPERPPMGYNQRRIAENAVVCGIAIGSTYGTMAAVNGFLRAHPAIPRPVRVLAGLLPAAGVAASPYVEDGVRHAMGATPTYPVIASLEHDAVASAGLLGSHHLSKRIARLNPPPGTPGGVAAGVTRAALASMVAGAASELSGQASHEEARRLGVQPAPLAPVEPHCKSIGRGLTQLPAAALFAASAASGKPLPPDVAARVVTGGWVFRRVLTPEGAGQGEPGGETRSGGAGSSPPPDTTTIPPA